MSDQIEKLRDQAQTVESVFGEPQFDSQVLMNLDTEALRVRMKHTFSSFVCGEMAKVTDGPSRSGFSQIDLMRSLPTERDLIRGIFWMSYQDEAKKALQLLKAQNIVGLEADYYEEEVDVTSEGALLEVTYYLPW